MSVPVPAIISAIDGLLTVLQNLVASARAKGELTAEQEAAYQARQAGIFSQPYAQPEAPSVVPPPPPPAPPS